MTQPFDHRKLLYALHRVQDAVPDFRVGRSSEGTGNIAIFDADGEYIGFIDLGDATATLRNLDDEWVTWDEQISSWV